MSSNSGSAIDIVDLRVAYPDRDRPAIADLSESIDEGEIVAITGPSGCGKSTLCRAIGGFIPEMIPAAVDGEIAIVGAWGDDDIGRDSGSANVFSTDPTIFIDGFEGGDTSGWSVTTP